MLEDYFQKGGLLSTYSLRKIFMKNVAINQKNIIISRIKEGFEGFLSIFDGNKYTTSDDEVALPKLLIKSLDYLGQIAESFKENGIIDLNQTKTTQPEYSLLETPKIKQKQPKQSHKKENVDNKTIKNQGYDIEL